MFFGLASSFFQIVPLGEVAQNNDALASSFMGLRQNIFNAENRSPSAYDPLYFFGVSAFEVYPSVSGKIDPSLSPRLLWGYGYAVGQEFSWGDTSYCGGKRTVMRYAGDEGNLIGYASLDGETRSRQYLDRLWFLPFTEQELAKGKHLNAWVSAVLRPKYLEINQTAVCRVECNIYGCWNLKTIEEVHTNRVFHYETSSSTLSYEIVNTSGEILLFSPFFEKRSLRMPFADFFLFSNSSIASWNLEIDGERVASSRKLSFSVEEDGFGVQRVRAFPVDENFASLPLEKNILDSSVFSEAVKIRFKDTNVGQHNYSFAFQDSFGNIRYKQASVTTYDSSMLKLNVSSEGINEGETIEAKALLTNALGSPLPGRTLRFSTENEVVTRQTDSRGLASVSLSPSVGVQPIEAAFSGEPEHPAASARRIVSVNAPVSAGSPPPARFDWLFLPIVLVVALAAVRLR